MSPARRALRAALRTTLAAGLVAGTATLAAGSAEAAPTAIQTATRTATQAATQPPLSVRITSMSRSTLPAKGAVVVSGLVANGSHDLWSDVKLTPFISSRPITSRGELAEAADTDPTLAVGDRLSDPDVSALVGNLAPGQQVPFRIRVPRQALQGRISGEAGVYWFGVHALGTSPEGERDAIADGRARTFLPLVPPALARHRTTDVSLVLPLRERARRAADGSLNGPTRWVGLTGDDGRLTRLADLAASAGSMPVTWAVDPAVLDALEDLGRGNPGLSLGSRRRLPASPSPSPSSSASPSASGSASAAPSKAASGSGAPVNAETREDARRALTTFLGAVKDHPVLALPYADADVSSLARRRPSLLRTAISLSAQRLQARQLVSHSTLAPPGGQLDPTLLSQVPKDSVLLLGDQGAGAKSGSIGPYAGMPTGQFLVLGDDLASSGGPAPTTAYDALEVRQRIVSDAALELISGDQRPIVVRFPPRWDPGPTWREADLFGGLQTRWLDVVPMQTAGTGPQYSGELPYSSEDKAAEIGDANVAATRALVRTGSVLGDLLDNANDVKRRLTAAALETSSYSARANRSLTVDQANALDATVRGKMARVQVTGTDPVTLSAAAGFLTVTLVNGLEQPVRLGVRVSDGPGVRITVPKAVDLAARERRTIRMPVTSTTGLHRVSVSPVTAQGQDVGTPFTFSLRTSQVGEVIWFVMAGGGALLLVMIVRRLVLRVRNHSRRTAGDAA